MWALKVQKENILDSQEFLDQCPGCGSSDIRMESNCNHIYSCLKCQLLFTNPRPNQRFIEENYCEGGYYAEFKPDKKWLGMWTRRINRVANYTPKGSSVLDVSAGIGTGLMLLRQRGYKTFGTEISTEAIKRAKELYDIDLFKGYIEDIDYPLENFDAITLWHVFEHLPHPGRSLSFLIDLLKPGGHIIIAVPNNSQLQLVFKPNQWSLSRKNRLDKLIPKVPYEKTFSEIHMIHFTPNSLRKILMGKGLEIIEMSHDNISLNPSLSKDIKYAVRNFGAKYLNLFMHKALFVCARKV